MKTINDVINLLHQLDQGALQAVARFVEDTIDQQKAVEAFYRELASLAVTRTDLPAMRDEI